MKIDFSKFNLLRLLNLEKTEKVSIFLVSIGLFLILNILIQNLVIRADLSAGKAYTLSQSTKKIVGKLDDKVNIKVFISSDLPLRLTPLKTDVVDLVNEYQKVSAGKIKVSLLDPKKDQKGKNEAESLGIPELKFSQIEKDKVAVSATYFGIAIFYADKKEIIPQATNFESLEYDITSSIYKLTQKKLTKIGILGQAEDINPQEDDLAIVKKILAQQYEIEFVNAASESGNMKIDPSLKTLLVFDSYDKKFAKNEKQALNNYLDQGGSAIFMFDGIYISAQLTAQNATHDLFDFFKDYGLRLNKDFVLSQESEMASFSTGQNSYLTSYPFWVKTTNFSSRDSIFSNISSLVFPWSSSITTVRKNNLSTKVLVKAEKNSWILKQDSVSLDPAKLKEPGSNELQSPNLIVETRLKKGGKMVLISSSRFVREQFIEGRPDNLGFVINLVNSYASTGALSGIRARTISIRPLKNLPEGSKDIIKFLNIFAMPALFALFGFVRYIKRR